MKRFFVRGERTLEEVLRAMAEDVSAIGDGRVFVGRERATKSDRAVRAGDEVLVHPRREEVAISILHHGDGVVAVDKPAGIPTIPDVRGAQGTLIDLAARAIGKDASALHVTSRLDRDVSGVVIFALDAATREAIANARAEGKYDRRYLAIARGKLPDRARFADSIARARDPKLRRAVPAGTRDAESAATRIVVVERAGDDALVAVAPETGRTHQIRVHLSAAGAPLIGDRPYGGPTRLTSASGRVLTVGRVALHCARVSISLPRCMITVASPVPRELEAVAHMVGLANFTEAVSCEV